MAVFGEEKDLSSVSTLDLPPLTVDAGKMLRAPLALAESSPPSLLRQPAAGLLAAGIQKAGVPTSADEARQLGWREVEVQPPQAPDAVVKFYPNEWAQAKQVTQTTPKQVLPYTRPTLKALHSASSPQLKVSPEYLQFAETAAGLLPISQTLRICSSITTTLDFSLSEDIPWLMASPMSGSAGADPVSVSVTVDTAGLSAQSSPYTGTLTVTNLGDPTDVWRVHVRLTITDTYAASTLYSFDASGNLQRRIRPDGSIIDYDYDELGRLTGMRYPDGSTVTYTYDANGNRTTMTDAHGTTVYQYDTDGRLTAVFNPGLNPVRYSYDLAGNLIGITYPDQRVMRYAYDSDGRMISAGNGTITTTYQYDLDTGYLVTQTLPNGITTGYGYDADDRLTDVVHRNTGGSLLLAFHYTLDANGMRTAVRKETPSGSEITSYAYDDLLHLASVAYPDSRQVDYAYDSLGNRTTMTVTAGAVVTVTNYTYDADNRLLQAGDEVFQYDANGNVIRRASPQRTIEYSYDTRNLLTRYSDGTHVVQFEYDGDGNRVAKVVDGLHTNYFNDVSGALTQVLMETDANWSVQRAYTYGLDRLGVESWQAGRQYYLYDSPWRGVVALADAAGASTANYSYDVFGLPFGLTANDANRFLYDSEQYDSETGLIYLRCRYYDPALGRFLARDSFQGWLQHPQSSNPYVFVHNNPVNFLDPRGDILWVDTAIGAGIGGLFGVVGAYGSDVIQNFADGKGWGESFAPRDDWQSRYTGAFVGGAVTGGMATINPFWAGSAGRVAGGAAGNLVTQWMDKKQGFDVGSFSTDVGLSTLFGRMTESLIPRGAGRPAEKLWPKLFGTVSQNVNWRRGGLGAEFDVIFGTPIRNAVEGRWVIGGDPGGVSLNKTAQLMLEIDDITGATYDPATGQIILFGQEDVALPEMDLDDLAVAVYSVYGGQDPGVSIDPPLVNGQFSVRYEGETRQTEFGWIMFESDRVMKTLALGRDNITGQPVTSNVPGYKSMLQRELESGTCVPGESSTRFWFQPKEVRLVRSEDGTSMVFDEVSMEVLTESKFQDNVVGDPEAEAFAAHFTQHYDEFAEEWPILKDLKRLGKVVAVIKWIKDNNIPIDLSFIENYDIEYFSTPDNTPAITVEGQHGTCHITITGGVSYRPPNEYLADDPVDPVTDAMRDAALSQRPAETDFLWDFQPPAQAAARGLMSAQSESLTAVAQSFTRSRKDGNVGFSEVDLSYPISGTFTLNLTRYYDSFADKAGGFGDGWQELPFQLRFPVAKQRFTFGPENIALDLYARIWLAERPAGREDEYILLGIDAGNLPLYRRPGAMDLLRQQADGSFLLTKVDGTRITFDTAGRVTSVTDPNGNLLVYIYDGSGRLTRIQGPGGRAIDLGYNDRGRISQASGPGGRLVTYSYDGNDNLHTVTDTAGQTQTYTYDSDPHSDHPLVSVMDAEGNPVFSGSYDDYNRATTSQFGTAADFAYDFNLAQNQTQITDPYNQQIQQRFDSEYRLIEQIDPLGNRFNVAYDGDFGPQIITDTHGVVTQLAYDVRGNLTTILDGAGGRVDLFYDWRDRLVASRDAEGVATGFGYDANGNLTTIYHDVTLVLDENGNLTSFYYNPNNVTSFAYGATGSLGAATNPLGHQSQFAYNADGQLDTARTPSGLDTTFDYDARSRLSIIQSGGSQASFDYDNADNLTGITTTAGSVSLGYDAVGNLTELTDAEGHSTAFAYDADGNLAQAQDAAGRATTYSYDVLGNLTQASLPNGTSSAYSYDELGRLAVAHTGLGPAAPQLALVQTSLDFGDVQLGSSRSLNLTLFNIGRAPLNVSGVMAMPPFTPTFAGPVVISPGGLLTVPVTFAPSDVGPATANLTVQSNDPVQPVQIISLRGEGTLKVLNLRATPTDTGIQLTWDYYTDPGTRPFVHFNIYRSTDPIPGDVTGLTPLNQSLTDPAATTFLDTSVSHGVPYYYAITAEYADGFEYRRVDPAGPAVYFTAFDRVGGFRSLAGTAQDELRPALVYNSAADEYLLVYERDASGDGSNLDVIGQRVAADGSLVGGTIPIFASSQHERRPRVAYNSSGNEYLVVFEYDYNGDGSNYVVLGRRVAADGSLPAGAFFVGGFIYHEFFPDVAYNPTANEYLAVFEFDSNDDGSNYDIVGRRVSGAGATIGYAFYVGNILVNGNPVHEWQPHIAYSSAANEYLVIFELDFYHNGSDYDIWGIRLSPTGSRNSGHLPISDYTAIHERNPRLAYNPATNEYLAVCDFDTNNGDVIGRRLTSAGAQIGDGFYIFASSRTDRHPDVAYNSAANDFMIVWEYDYAGYGSSDWDILGRRISSLGTRIGNAHFVGGVTAHNEFRPVIAYNPAANEFLVAWEYDYFGNGSDFDIWAQRLGPENPQLQVTPNSLDFGTQTTSLPLTISNVGTGALDWFVNSDRPWLNASPRSGSTVGSTTVTGLVNRAGLSPAVYTGTLSIHSDGGDVTVPVTVTVLNAPPDQPHTPAPPNGAIGQTSTGSDRGIPLNWLSSDPNGDPVTYDLYFSINQGLVAAQDPGVRIEQGLTTPTFRVTSLDFLTTYHWLVVAHDNRGATTNGPIWNFTTAAVPAPQLVPLTPDPTNNDRPTFAWETVIGAARYHIQIDDDAAFGSPVVNDATLTAISYTPSVGLPEAVLHWRVRSIDPKGQAGAFSPADTFEIDRTPPPVPTLIPVQPDRTRNRRPTLAWNEVAGASSYRLQVADNLAFAPVLLDLTLAGTSYVPSDDLPSGSIFWRVASRDAAGNLSPFCSSDQFEIDVTPPAPISGLATSSDGENILLTWEPLTGPPTDFDHFNVYRATAPFSNVSGMSPLDGSLVVSTTIAFTDTTATSDETYHYAVTAVDTAGNENKAISSVAARLVYRVSGNARFWNGGAGVPGVQLSLKGDRLYTGQSDATGAYIVTGALAGAYTLTPSKSDGVNGISAYDASLVLQHSVGLITLAGYPSTAADVTKNGSISAMDASYILQKAVNLITLPFPGAGVVWDFAPPSRSYTNLSSNLSGQDFTAVLLGDVSGNWSAMGALGVWKPEIASVQNTTATLSLPQATVLPGGQVTIPLTLTLSQGEVYGADIALSYDTAVVSATAIAKGALATGWSMASNLTTPGVVRVAMAGATPITTSGELLLLVFNAVGSAGSGTDLTLTRGDLNEGGIPTDVQHGYLSIATPVQAAFTASPTVGAAPLAVSFTNLSTGDFDTCAWTFGNGGTSADCNDPTYTYTAAGVYTVTLTVSGLGGSDTETKVEYITVYQPPTAEFSGDPTSGPASLAVSFTNLSTGDFNTCVWTFGDGGTSNECNDPTYTYTAVGVYTVTLAVSGLGGSDTETKVEYITVYLLDISGAVRFWEDAAGVPGVLLTLEGDSIYTGMSDTIGEYTVTGVSAGDYTLTPNKSDGVNGISAYDASLVLQHAAELTTLTGYAATAADVNQSGVISSIDASYILQKAVDLITLPFPGAGVVWDFDPPSRSYTNLSSDQTDQGFTAVLLGDVSGNWLAGGSQALAQAAGTPSLALPNLYAEPGERITVTLAITLNQAEVYGADIVVSYTPSVLLAVSVSSGDVAQDFLTVSNLNQPGLVRVAMAGAQPVTGDGHLLTLVFDVVGELGDVSPLQITAAELNEGSVPAQRQDGSISVVDLPDYDFNRDCKIDIVDIMRVASRWRTSCENPNPDNNDNTPNYDPLYDIDDDCDIDIVDIMLVLFHKTNLDIWVWV